MSSGARERRFFGGLSTPEPGEGAAETFGLTEVAVANAEPIRTGGRLAQLKSQIHSDLEPSVGIHIRRALAQVCPCRRACAVPSWCHHCHWRFRFRSYALWAASPFVAGCTGPGTRGAVVVYSGRRVADGYTLSGRPNRWSGSAGGC